MRAALVLSFFPFFPNNFPFCFFPPSFCAKQTKMERLAGVDLTRFPSAPTIVFFSIAMVNSRDFFLTSYWFDQETSFPAALPFSHGAVPETLLGPPFSHPNF